MEKQHNTTVSHALLQGIRGVGGASILSLLNFKLILNSLKGGSGNKAMSPVMCAPFLQRIHFVLGNIFSSSLANWDNADDTKIHLHHY